MQRDNFCVNADKNHSDFQKAIKGKMLFSRRTPNYNSSSPRLRQRLGRVCAYNLAVYKITYMRRHTHTHTHTHTLPSYTHAEIGRAQLKTDARFFFLSSRIYDFSGITHEPFCMSFQMRARVREREKWSRESSSRHAALHNGKDPYARFDLQSARFSLSLSSPPFVAYICICIRIYNTRETDWISPRSV